MKLPIHRVRQLALSGLVAILLGVVLVGYDHSRHSMQALRSNMDVVAPAQAHLQSISSLLTISGQAFQLFANRDQVGTAEVMIPLERLAEGLDELHRRLVADLGPPAMEAPPAERARAAFEALIEATRADGSGEASSRLLTRSRARLAESRSWLREAVQRSQAAGLGIDRARLGVLSNLLNSASLALERYETGHELDFSAVTDPVQRTLALLNDLPTGEQLARYPGSEQADSEALAEEVEALSRALLPRRAADLPRRDPDADGRDLHP